MDYRGDTDLYPVEERMTKDTFPPISELYVYGEDVPVPESVEELRCRYNENDRTPPLELHELEGYHVPPLGIVSVGVHGSGQRAGRSGMIYPAGTFREDRHTIGKELGASGAEMALARERQRKDAVVDAMAILFEDKGYAIFDVVKDKDPQIVAAAFKWAFEKVDDSDSPREAINFVKLLLNKLEHKTGVVEEMESRQAKLTIEEAFDLIDKTAKLIENKMYGEAVEGEFEDLTDLE